MGAKVIALTLRDAGAEVIYTGLRKSPETIARIAVQEDVHAVGLGLLSGAHNELAAETLHHLRELDGGDIKLFVGGTIPAADHQRLLRQGASGVFSAEMKLDDVLAQLRILLDQ